MALGSIPRSPTLLDVALTLEFDRLVGLLAVAVVYGLVLLGIAVGEVVPPNFAGGALVAAPMPSVPYELRFPAT